MRVFAGPNGSGKSTIIQSVREYQTVYGKVDFGVYVNADDLVRELTSSEFRFSKYKIIATKRDFISVAKESGLIGEKFSLVDFLGCHKIEKGKIILVDAAKADQLAQVLADYLRKKLLKAKKKFSFETVFSHESKLDIMREAKEKGYKVYLYFVSTNSPEINKERVLLRVRKGGHNVPPDLIESRYKRSMDFLFDAAQITYQTYFWDNSGDQPDLFTYFKVHDGKKAWKKIDKNSAPDWFIHYDADKVNR